MKWLFIALFVTLTASCTTVPKVTDQSLLSTVNSLKIDNHVKVTEEIKYQTLGDVWGLGIGGAIGGSMQSGLTDSEKFSNYLKEKNIDIGKIAFDTFVNQLTEENSFSLNTSNPDATIFLEVYYYGIHPAGMFSSDVEPVLGIQAVAKHSTGEVIWSKQEYIHLPPDDLIQPRPLGEYLSSPELLNTAYTKLSEQITQRLISDLKKHHNGS